MVGDGDSFKSILAIFIQNESTQQKSCFFVIASDLRAKSSLRLAVRSALIYPMLS